MLENKLPVKKVSYCQRRARQKAQEPARSGSPASQEGLTSATTGSNPRAVAVAEAPKLWSPEWARHCRHASEGFGNLC